MGHWPISWPHPYSGPEITMEHNFWHSMNLDKYLIKPWLSAISILVTNLPEPSKGSCHFFQMYLFLVAQSARFFKKAQTSREPRIKALVRFCGCASWPQGYKTSSMLNSAEQEIYPAHKCWNANNCWHLKFTSMINTASERLKAKQNLYLSALIFMSSWNFVLSWVEREKSFIT